MVPKANMIKTIVCTIILLLSLGSLARRTVEIQQVEVIGTQRPIDTAVDDEPSIKKALQELCDAEQEANDKLGGFSPNCKRCHIEINQIPGIERYGNFPTINGTFSCPDETKPTIKHFRSSGTLILSCDRYAKTTDSPELLASFIRGIWGMFSQTTTKKNNYIKLKDI